ncbi:MAG: DegT/DnrJ/EryC1/StrS family aminotransferase [Bacteroidia bacterium]
MNEDTDISGVSLGLTVDSGKNALRIALRSVNLHPGSIVGIPAFCCKEVISAVREEGFTPYYFDMEKPGTYWALYDEKKVIEANIKAIIVTHLYGYVHPFTKEIVDMCARNNVKLIHDAAQSFGIDTSDFGDHPVVYSFGPGKSTTAALGGEVLNVRTHPGIKTKSFWDNQEARFFFNTRLFGTEQKRSHFLFKKLYDRFKKKKSGFFELSAFQKEKALQAKAIALNKRKEREERYLILKDAVSKLNSVSIAYETKAGLFFKVVLYVNKNVENFIKYLEENKVPHFRLGTTIDVGLLQTKDLPNFKQTYLNLVELSSERSIPVSETKRVAQVLSAYKNED